MVQWYALWAPQVALVIKQPACQYRKHKRCGFCPWMGKIPPHPHPGGHGNSLWYSCLENPMDRGAWRGAAQRVTKSRTQLKRLSKHAWHALWAMPWWNSENDPPIYKTWPLPPWRCQSMVRQGFWAHEGGGRVTGGFPTQVIFPLATNPIQRRKIAVATIPL